MKMMLDIAIQAPEKKMIYTDHIFLIGSCFTEHIGGRLADHRFSVLQNPNGILFDPISVCNSLHTYISNKVYGEQDLFFYNELWQSWAHHSQFSGLHQKAVLAAINTAQHQANDFLKKANWLVITLGSSFAYQLVDKDMQVANCHRAPRQWFNKRLIPTQETTDALQEVIDKLSVFNPTLQIIFTISPVRHIRDGVTENNRSKARLIEAVHSLTDTNKNVSYFPAYELVIDVLRDHRFYDIDLVHPNYAATEFVFEKFASHYIDKSQHELMEEIKKIMIAYRHRAFQPDSVAHQTFLNDHAVKTNALINKYPFLQLTDVLDHFTRRR